jgi:hypothetical protein
MDMGSLVSELMADGGGALKHEPSVPRRGHGDTRGEDANGIGSSYSCGPIGEADSFKSKPGDGSYRAHARRTRGGVAAGDEADLLGDVEL